MVPVVFILLMIGRSSCGESKAEHRQRDTADAYYDDYYDDYGTKPQYSYSYAVKDPDNLNLHGHKQTRDGDVVKGQYVVLLPDGNKQVVQYEAGKFGYRANVVNNHGSHEKLSEEYEQKYVHPYQESFPLHSNKRLDISRNKLHHYEPVSSTQPPNTRRIQKHRYQNPPVVSPEQRYQKLKPDSSTFENSKADIATDALKALKEAAMAQSEVLHPTYEVPETSLENSFPVLAQGDPALIFNKFPQRGPAFGFRKIPVGQPLHIQRIPSVTQQIYRASFPTREFINRNRIFQYQQPYLAGNEINIIQSPFEQFYLPGNFASNEHQVHAQGISTAGQVFRQPVFEQPIYSVSGSVYTPRFQPRVVDSIYGGGVGTPSPQNVFNYNIGDKVPVTTTRSHLNVVTPTTVKSKNRFHTNIPKQQFQALHFLHSDDVGQGSQTVIDNNYGRRFPADSRFSIPSSQKSSFFPATHNIDTPKFFPESEPSVYVPVNTRNFYSLEKPVLYKAVGPPLVIETPKTYSPPAFKSKH